MSLMMYSWATLKCKRGNQQHFKHIINKETMSSLCGQFKPDLIEREDLIYRKMADIFTSVRCRRCIQISESLEIKLENL